MADDPAGSRSVSHNPVLRRVRIGGFDLELDTVWEVAETKQTMALAYVLGGPAYWDKPVSERQVLLTTTPGSAGWTIVSPISRVPLR